MGHLGDSIVQRRRLSAELRKARSRANLTQQKVSEELGWSSSKLIRIESGQVGITRSDLKALLQQYGVTEAERVAPLAEMARQSKRQTWGSYRDVLHPEFLIYLASEGSASSIQQFERLVLPGLLQTEEYAREIITAFSPPGLDRQVIDRQVETRMKRQEILDRANPPRMSFVLDEAVVRRRVGAQSAGRGIMRRQLERLKEVSGNLLVSIQVSLFSAGAHLGLHGPFVILEFPDPEDDPLVFLEKSSTGVSSRDGHDDLQLYKATFRTLEETSTDPGHFLRIIDGFIAEI